MPGGCGGLPGGGGSLRGGCRACLCGWGSLPGGCGSLSGGGGGLPGGCGGLPGGDGACLCSCGSLSGGCGACLGGCGSLPGGGGTFQGLGCGSLPGGCGSLPGGGGGLPGGGGACLCGGVCQIRLRDCNLPPKTGKIITQNWKPEPANLALKTGICPPLNRPLNAGKSAPGIRCSEDAFCYSSSSVTSSFLTRLSSLTEIG